MHHSIQGRYTKRRLTGVLPRSAKPWEIYCIGAWVSTETILVSYFYE